MRRKGGGECEELRLGSSQARSQRASGGYWPESRLHIGREKILWGQESNESKSLRRRRRIWDSVRVMGPVCVWCGGGRRYCGERAGATVNFSARARGAQAFVV